MELQELLMCILIVVYGLVWYVVGRTNLLEVFIIKLLRKIVRWYGESEDTE